MDGRVKPGHDDVLRVQVIGKPKKDDKEPRLPETDASEILKLRPIGLDDGKVVIHDSFFDPLPDEFCGF